MSYTIEQKREFERKLDDLLSGYDLDEQERILKWMLEKTAKRAPTPPRVLSELEGELLEALTGLMRECALAGLTNARDFGWPGVIAKANAAIQKAEGQA